ncbi:TadE/TadG family type IV pilus assembly protein [Actinomadura sp. SCN-SB]|uniref:TadE/TadG family type IV pilus assembly protein n=1 Tax=Actinomadura sp. SCN-SB TaxID=3373092 RepID=UPI003750A878
MLRRPPFPPRRPAFPPRPRRHSGRRDQGSLNVFAVVITLVVVIFFGAIVDFGQKLQARHDAYAIAQEAARAGAGQVDLDHAYAEGRFVVDHARSVRAAQSHLRASGQTGSVTVIGPRSIRVRVTITKPALFLSLIGIPTLTVNGVATADLVTGAEGPQQP